MYQIETRSQHVAHKTSNLSDTSLISQQALVFSVRLSSPAGPGVVQRVHHQRHFGLLWANPRADVKGNPGTHGLSHRLPGSTSEEQSGPKSQVGPLL